MEAIFQTFLNPILPVFAMMLGGMTLAKRGLFDDTGAQVINRFVFFIALPALLFALLSEAAIEQVDGRMLALYLLSEMILYITGAWVARFIMGRAWGEALLLGMASCFVNHVFFVLPIAQFIYGAPAEIPITAIIAVDTTIVFGGTMVGLEIATARGEPWRKVTRQFIRNPVLISIVLGCIVNHFDLNIHDGIKTFTGFAGRAAAPAALFSLGIILSGTQGSKFDIAALLTTGFKVLLHPMVAWFFFGFISIQQLWHDSALLVAAGPCGAMPFVLALQYKIPAGTIGKAIIYSTVASLATLSIIA